MKFGFIGAGKVGFSLGKYLTVKGQTVTGYYSEFNEDAIEAAQFTDSRSYESMEQLLQDSDVIFLTVPDGMIGNLWNQLRTYQFKDKIVCHTSGALSSEIFEGIAEHESFGYSIHPLFAVSDKYTSYKDLPDSFFTIEGTQKHLETMKNLLESIGNSVCVISKENKIKYHAAAAVASNLVVGILNMAETMMQECGFEKEQATQALAPIIRGNVENILRQGSVQALTGPIERNDVSTVKKHLSVLKGQYQEIYKAVSGNVVNIAKEKYPNRDYSEMEEVLL
ncbi:MAG: DUF2520 domain-containing protein [Eubacterium sp.]|nr:DUF2520 domain-containing protein [Eubacterium sp.]